MASRNLAPRTAGRLSGNLCPVAAENWGSRPRSLLDGNHPRLVSGQYAAPNTFAAANTDTVPVYAILMTNSLLIDTPPPGPPYSVSIPLEPL